MEKFSHAQSYWGLANEYFSSADTLLMADNRKIVPLLFLQCHAIELALKSFLVSAGVDKSELRHMGHDLLRCMEKARELGLRISLSNEQLLAVKKANDFYESKRLEYFYGEAKTLGSVDGMQVVVKTLLNDVFNQVTRPNFDAMTEL